MSSRPCPKCAGSMETGYLYDGSGNPIVSTWSKQPQKKGLLTYLGLTTGEPKNKERRELVTYRCTECGYLENYA